MGFSEILVGSGLYHHLVIYVDSSILHNYERDHFDPDHAHKGVTRGCKAASSIRNYSSIISKPSVVLGLGSPPHALHPNPPPCFAQLMSKKDTCWRSWYRYFHNSRVSISTLRITYLICRYAGTKTQGDYCGTLSDKSTFDCGAAVTRHNPP